MGCGSTILLKDAKQSGSGPQQTKTIIARPKDIEETVISEEEHAGAASAMDCGVAECTTAATASSFAPLETETESPLLCNGGHLQAGSCSCSVTRVVSYRQGTRPLPESDPCSPVAHPPVDSDPTGGPAARNETTDMAASGGATVPFPARPCTDEERLQARRQANFFGASSVSEGPVALWVLGPSAVGKSTISAQASETFGIPRKSDPDDDRGGWLPDAVVIDGEFFRAAHGDYQRWIRTPQWRAAYPALKQYINQEKSKMLTDAARQHKHLIIPHTALKLEECLRELVELASLGYTNHILGVIGQSREAVRERGRKREQEIGKRYAPDEYDRSIAALRPMMSACNGRYEVVMSIPHEQDGGERHMSYKVLTRGRGPTDSPDIPPEARSQS